MKTQILLITGLAVADAQGVLAAPGSVLVRVAPAADEAGRRRCELLASGAPEAVRRHPLAERPGPARGGPAGERLRGGGATGAATEWLEIDRPGAVLLPGLVNAHCHLDLTHIGPRSHDPSVGFLPWVEMIRQERATTEEDVRASVAQGVQLALAGGTVAVGDIGGAVGGRLSGWAAEALGATLMSGVSFLEFFGVGAHEARAAAALGQIGLEVARSSVQADAVRLGLQPHAPYSVSPALYARIAEFGKTYGVRLCTHLAESPEEHLLIETGQGPLADLLRGVGAWDERTQDLFTNPGVTPLGFCEHALRTARFAAAHVNDADDRDIAILASTRTSVVYCPRASAYFGAERRFGPHRYREMLAAGVNVALGTDSIVNLPAESADPARGGISVLDEMRFLHRRDGTDPKVLLGMGTVNGARALGLHAASFTLRGPLAGPIGGVVAVEVGEEGDGSESGLLERVMTSEARAELLVIGVV